MFKLYPIETYLFIFVELFILSCYYDFMKATHWTISRKFLDFKTPKKEGFSKPKWIEFCEAFIDEGGVTLKLYEARQTASKYISVIYNKKTFKVRYSNHKPIKYRELNQDCDFFVGVNHTAVTTTIQAIEATKQWLEKLKQEEGTNETC